MPDAAIHSPMRAEASKRAQAAALQRTLALHCPSSPSPSHPRPDRCSRTRFPAQITSRRQLDWDDSVNSRQADQFVGHVRVALWPTPRLLRRGAVTRALPRARLAAWFTRLLAIARRAVGSLARRYLASNSLTGSIPTAISLLTQLFNLCVSLRRPAPPVRRAASTLCRHVWSAPPPLMRVFADDGGVDRSLGSNRFTGTIPSQLGLLTRLDTLCVALVVRAARRNLRSRQLLWRARLAQSPSSLVGVARVCCFLPTHARRCARQLHSNSLTGTIPATIDQLTALTSLCVSRALAPPVDSEPRARHAAAPRSRAPRPAMRRAVRRSDVGSIARIAPGLCTARPSADPRAAST